MKESILRQIMELKKMTITELQKKHEELFEGKKATTNNKTHLWRRLAFRIQELEYGGLPQDAKDKLATFIKEYDPINNVLTKPNCPAEGVVNKRGKIRDRRLPIPGTLLTKEYKGTLLQVKALEKGFEYNSKFYKSLTALAKEITGSHWSGYEFFNL